MLTPENTESRLTFSRTWLDVRATDELWNVHLDEKWFFAFPLSRRLYCPPEVTPPVQRIRHKGHIPKVMFLAALGEPTPHFDGAVGIWPITEMFTPKRASAAHPRVNGQLVPYEKPTTMDGALFQSMVQRFYIPAILALAERAFRTGIQRIVVHSQIDNAGGHAVHTSVEALNRIGYLIHPRLRIHFYCQPPNSPDLNVLDLGAWNSLQKAVPPLVYDHAIGRGNIQERIIETVQSSFQTWNARAKCAKLFDTRRAFMYETIMHQGGNTFKQPHIKNLQAKLESVRDLILPFPPLPPPPAPPLPETPITLRLSVSTVLQAQRPVCISLPSNLSSPSRIP